MRSTPGTRRESVPTAAPRNAAPGTGRAPASSDWTKERVTCRASYGITCESTTFLNPEMAATRARSGTRSRPRRPASDNPWPAFARRHAAARNGLSCQSLLRDVPAHHDVWFTHPFRDLSRPGFECFRPPGRRSATASDDGPGRGGAIFRVAPRCNAARGDGGIPLVD